jgi:MFS family permease
MTTGFGVGWRQVTACGIFLAVGAMIASAFSVLAVPLAKEFHPSRMVLMLAMTLLSGGTAIMSPLVGNLMDRVPVRRLMMLGAVLLVAGFLALSFATSIIQVLIIYGLFMAGANVLTGPMATSVHISRWFVRRRGAAIGLAITGVAVGGFVFPPLIQALLDSFAWREAIRVLALIVFVCTAVAVALIVDRPADRGLHPDGAAQAPQIVRTDGPAQRLTTAMIFGDPTFWCATALFAVILSGMKGMVTNLVPLALDQGIQANVAALLISIFAVCGFVAKLGFAAVADRVNLRVLMFASLVGFATGMACLTRAEAGYAVIALGVGLVGGFGGLMVPLQGLLIPKIYGVAVVGRVSGLLNMVMLCALLATPPIFGLIFDRTGNYDAIFLAFAALAAGMMFVVPYIRMGPRGPSSPVTAMEEAELRSGV